MFLGAVYRLLRLYYRTFRVAVLNEAILIDHLKNGDTVLLCCWHQQLLLTIGYLEKFRRFSPLLMISQSHDGDIAAGLCQRCGWRPVRGSSSRGGMKALKNMIREFRKSRLAGHIVDGPRGPSGKVKSGTIMLAMAAHAVIVPVFCSADRAWYFNSWDRFMIPKPFANVQFQFGEMIDLNNGNEKLDGEFCRHYLESAMLPYLNHP